MGTIAVAELPVTASPQLGSLRVLLLEDSAVDADLILHELRQGGYEPVARRVASSGEMLEALNDDASWQIVLLDYSLQEGGTALDALAALAELNLDLPAILISGVIGEEEAADALRAGARDFVNKGNLMRLVPAVARELEQVEARRLRRQGEEDLRQSEQRLLHGTRRRRPCIVGVGSRPRPGCTGRRSSRRCSASSPGSVRRNATTSSSSSSIRTTASSSGRASRRRSSETRRPSSIARCGRTAPFAGTSGSRSAFAAQTDSRLRWPGSRST